MKTRSKLFAGLLAVILAAGCNPSDILNPSSSSEGTSSESTSLSEVTSQEVTSQEQSSELTTEVTSSEEVTSLEESSEEVTSQEESSEEVTSLEESSEEVTSQEESSEESSVVEINYTCSTVGLTSDYSIPEVDPWGDEGTWALHKFEEYKHLNVGDEFNIVIKGNNEVVKTFGYNDIKEKIYNNASNKDELGETPLIVEGTDGKMKINVEGGYTFYAFVHKDGGFSISTTIWDFVKPEAKMDPGLYLISVWGGDNNVFVEPSEDKANGTTELHKYELYTWRYATDEILFKVADQNKTVTLGYSHVTGTQKCGTPYDGDLVELGWDQNKIHINVTGGYTFYITVFTDGGLGIWINSYDLQVA